jgi:hypothetical protein
MKHPPEEQESVTIRKLRERLKQHKRENYRFRQSEPVPCIHARALSQANQEIRDLKLQSLADKAHIKALEDQRLEIIGVLSKP